MKGAPELLRLLKGLQRRGVIAVGRKSVTFGNKQLIRGMKGRVPVESAILKKSLAQKVKVYRGVVIGIVGPRTDAARVVLVRGKPVARDPRHYAHLVEYGHGNVRPHSFIRATAVEDAAEIATAMEAGAKLALIKELARG